MDRNRRFVFHANTNGVRARGEELRRAADTFDVIALQETRIRTNAETATVLTRLFPQHSLVSSFPHDDQGVGCALLVRTSLPHRSTFHRTIERHRLLGVEVTLSGGLTFNVASLYVPSAGSTAVGHLQRELLETALSPRWALVVGDLNARSRGLGCLSSNSNGRALEEFLNTSQALVLNDPGIPTFSHSSTPFQDCIDWALASSAAAARISCSPGGCIGSDHLPLEIICPSVGNVPSSTPRGIPCLPRWRTTGHDWRETFARDLSDRLLERQILPAITPSSPEEVEQMAEAIETAITESADACLRRSRPKLDSDGIPPPWWLRLLIQERKRLRRQLHRLQSDPSLRRQLNLLRAEIRRATREARLEHLEQQAQVFSQGPRKPSFWPAVRRWFRGSSPPLPPLNRPEANSNEPPAISPADRAEIFASHLTSIFRVPQHASFDGAFFGWAETDVSQDPIFHPLATADEEDSTSNDPEEPTRSVTATDVARELQNLRGGRAPGPDGISTDLLKAAPSSLTTALAALFTGSLRVGFVPTRWRLGWVRMLPKPGKPWTSPSHYRPIALTSCVGKILERLFARRLLKVCDRLHLLAEEQSGFRPGRDAQEQILLLVQRAVQATNGGLATAVAALDVAKAYDSVWHAGLLYSCREVLSRSTCRWLAGFLHHRRAAVLENGGHLSSEFPVPSGVPQGSPLSPLLYILYTRDMPLPRGPHLGATAYADDICCWASARTPAAAWSILQPHLRALVEWGQRWRLRFSAEKTQAAYIARRWTGWPPGALDAPSFNGTELHWAAHVDLLGVRLDRRLTFQPHAREITRRLSPRVQELQRLLYTARRVPQWVGVFLWKIFIRSALTYAAPVILTACDTAWLLLERLERRALRTACRLPWRTPTSALYRRAAVNRLRDEAKRLAGDFLLRHSRQHNLRLLRAFAVEVPQSRQVVRFEEPLDRLLACVRPPDQQEVARRARTAAASDRHRGAQHRGRRTRATQNPPLFWGANPWSLT